MSLSRFRLSPQFQVLAKNPILFLSPFLSSPTWKEIKPILSILQRTLLLFWVSFHTHTPPQKPSLIILPSTPCLLELVLLQTCLLLLTFFRLPMMSEYWVQTAHEVLWHDVEAAKGKKVSKNTYYKDRDSQVISINNHFSSYCP